jgi:hypothetical protein
MAGFTMHGRDFNRRFLWREQESPQAAAGNPKSEARNPKQIQNPGRKVSNWSDRVSVIFAF